jgi:hypothetical protein
MHIIVDLIMDTLRCNMMTWQIFNLHHLEVLHLVATRSSCGSSSSCRDSDEYIWLFIPLACAALLQILMNSLLLCAAIVGGFEPDSSRWPFSTGRVAKWPFSRWQFTLRLGRVAVGTVYLFLFMLHGLVLDLALCWTTTRDIYNVMDIVMDDANVCDGLWTMDLYEMYYEWWMCM